MDKFDVEALREVDELTPGSEPVSPRVIPAPVAAPPAKERDRTPETIARFYGWKLENFAVGETRQKTDQLQSRAHVRRESDRPQRTVQPMKISARDAILHVLMDGPSYGLELVETINRRSLGALKLSFSIYPVLRELEDSGLLTSWEGAPLPQRGNRPRRYYQLTEQGLHQAKANTATTAKALTS